MVTLSTAYSITIKVGEKLFAGHVDNSLAIVPQYEPILRKSLGGRFDLDFVSVDLDMRISGLTYERTSGEAATHNDFADLRAACSSPVSVAFVYGAIVPGNIVLRGNAKLSEYQETAGSGKISGQWSCRLKSVRGSVQEEVVPEPPQDVKYGLLYNWYAVTDARDIANTGWYVPTIIEISSLYTFADGSADGGGKLKETGLIYWNNPNTGATNDYKFNARGGGQRLYNTGLFTDLKNVGVLWTATANDLITARCWGVQTTTQTILLYTIKENTGGIGVRILRPATAAEQLLTDGTACDPYVGNDGKVYRTVKIDTQVWLADNLCETLFRNGEAIPEVTGAAAWAALTTAGMCAYNNDWTNV